MEFRDNKVDLGIGLLAVFMIVAMFRFVSGGRDSDEIRGEDVNYEMPRPKSDLVGEFELGDREIDRRYVNPFEKKNKAAAPTAPAAAAAKKPAAKAAVKTADNKKTEDKKPKTDVSVVDTAKHDGLSPDNAGRAAQDMMQDQIERKTAADQTATNTNDVLSPAQWRALLLGEPTQANMDKLVAALMKNEVDSNTFYGIIDDLLKSQNKDSRSVAFYGLRKVPTAASFTAAVAFMDESKPSDDVSKSLKEFLQTYSDSSKRAVLKTLVKSTNKSVAYQAGTVVLAGIQSSSGSGVDGREARSEVTTQSNNSKASWKEFASLFQSGTWTTDSSFQTLAQSILQSLA